MSEYNMTIVASVVVPERYGSALLSMVSTALNNDFAPGEQRENMWKYGKEEVARVLDAVANEAFQAGIAYQKKMGESK